MTRSELPMKNQQDSLHVKNFAPNKNKKGSFEKSLAILDKLPFDVMIKITESVFDIAKAHKIMEGKQQEFEYTLTLIREGNFDRKERANMLIQLLKDSNFPESTQTRLIDSICNIVEGQ